MIRVAVVDDEPLARSGVIVRLAAYPDDVVVACEYADGATAAAGLGANPVDLVFIDVQMPGMNGLDVLAALPVSQRPLAILLTAHESFAVRAFALNAVDYLLKPIDDERFVEALERARQALAWRGLGQSATVAPGNNEDRTKWLSRFTVRIGRREVFIDVDDVAWIQADGDYATLHVGESAHLLREPMHSLSARLDPSRFVRVHRSVIVRLDRVAEMQALSNRDAMLRMDDGTPLRVSRTYIDQLLAGLQGKGGG